MNFIIKLLIFLSFISCSSNQKKKNSDEINTVLNKKYTLKEEGRYIPLWSRNLKEWINKYGKIKNKQKPEVYYFLEEKELKDDQDCDKELKKELNKKIFYEVSLYLKENHFEYLLSKQSLNQKDIEKIKLINDKIMKEVNKKSEIYRSDKEERVYSNKSTLYCRSLSRISRNDFKEIIDSGFELFKKNNRSPQSLRNYDIFFKRINIKYNQGIK